MLYREAKIIRPSLPDLTLAVNSTASRGTIRILFRYVVESLRMLAIDGDSFGDHSLSLDFLGFGIVEIIPIVPACVFEAAPIKTAILSRAHVTECDYHFFPMVSGPGIHILHEVVAIDGMVILENIRDSLEVFSGHACHV